VRALEKRKEQVGEIEDIERGGLWGVHNTKSFKNYIG
jgi:hypothetical protein